MDTTIDVVEVGTAELGLSGFGFFFNAVVDHPAQLIFDAANLGPAAAGDVTFEAALPDGLAVDSVRVEPADALSCGSEAETVRCTTAALERAANVRITVTAIPQVADVPFTVSASLTSTSPDPGRFPNTASIGPFVAQPAVADLSMLVFGGGTGTVGTASAVDLVVSNGSPIEATDVELVATVPDGFTIQSLTARPPATCAVVGQSVTCRTATIDAFNSVTLVTLNLVADVPVSGVLDVSVGSATPDPNPDNNIQRVGLSAAVPGADLVAAIFGPSAISVGQVHPMTVSTSNFGPLPAGATTLNIDVPAPFTAVGVSGTGWTCAFTAHTANVRPGRTCRCSRPTSCRCRSVPTVRGRVCSLPRSRRPRATRRARTTSARWRSRLRSRKPTCRSKRTPRAATIGQDAPTPARFYVGNNTFAVAAARASRSLRRAAVGSNLRRGPAGRARWQRTARPRVRSVP